jgi:hypothetical protein
MTEKQAYCWYLPANTAAHAARLVAGGCAHLRVKAGGDGGGVWQQWADQARTQAYRDAGLRVTPWFYTWPLQEDIDAIARAHAAHPFDECGLNPETEWRWRNSNENPWNSLAEANQGARDWVARLRSAVPAARLAYSSCPTWYDFPYEGFAETCDQAEPQHYWPDNLMAPDGETGEEAGEDSVEAHVRRAGTAQPTVPILTASREYPDAGVIDLARNALGDYPTLAGFSMWEAGNGAYQWDAARACYALLDTLAPQTAPDRDAEERAALLAYGATIAAATRGTIAREGVADLTAFGGVAAERIAVYERLVTHRLSGNNHILLLALWDSLRAEGKVTLYG